MQSFFLNLNIKCRKACRKFALGNFENIMATISTYPHNIKLMGKKEKNTCTGVGVVNNS